MTDTLDLVSIQRHTVRTLIGSQAIGALAITIGIATASLLARDISGSDEMAGLAQTAQVLGQSAGAWWLARVMSLHGRRIGLTTGYLVGAVGGALMVAGGALDSMTLLLVGAALLGLTSAANYASRYAATDLAEPDARARALSVVVWASTIGAVAGPNLTAPSAAVARALRLPELTGPFVLGTGAMLAAAIVVWLLLRPDPLLVARAEAGSGGVRHGTSWSRVRAVVHARPVVGLAIAGLAGAHAAMVAVMVMTPLHMEHGGAQLKVIGLVISIHVLGMFAFAPIFGWVADRWGRPLLLTCGGVVLLVAVALAGASPVGTSHAIVAGLFLLGIGWSMATVASSTLLSEQVPIHDRTDVQGAADMAMGLAAGLGGGLSGFVVGTLGFAWLAGLAGVLGLVVTAAGVLARRHAVSV
ncbi:MAG TPA: MFS transporter [Marmoricola sp.]|nr:MFS transporter [Marmoricola sp.]